jgi:hypothetical protein
MWRSNCFVAICAALAMAWAQAAQAVVIRADRTDSQYVSLGANSAYASVGQIYGTTSPTSGFYASGTLIAPDWVLTAAHVVDDATSLKFSIGGASYTGTNWTAYAGWTGDLLAGYDIGLVHLSSLVPGITPATRYTGSSELGQVGTAVGYGMTGTGNSGAKTFDGKKRGAQNVIDNIVNPRLFRSDFDNPRKGNDSSFGSSSPLNLEGLIAPGDSGGGVFITTGTGTFLMGINSFCQAWDGKANSDYGDISGYTRVSAFNSWINSIIGGATSLALDGSLTTAGSLRAMDTPTIVPEPSTVCLLVSGILALLLWRRFRRL